MLPREILRHIRRLQLRARRAVEDMLGGEYHSVFKGAGIAFDEVRAYQPGDDVRAIDWNVTARMGQPFIKRFVEERELTVILLVDASGSTGFGSRERLKRELAGELAAVLAFSAASNNDRVGLIQFTSRVEHFVPPGKGSRHVLRIIRDILFHEAVGRGTSLAEGLDFLNRVQRRRAVVFLFSDFFDQGYEKAMKRAARRHDLIAVRLGDPLEDALPSAGLLELQDAETGERHLVDSGSEAVRQAYASAAALRLDQFQKLRRATGTDLIEVTTAGDHLDALMRFFRQRERRLRRP